jgi:alpha-beta hydrolase superfamily lysophospholipase
MSETKSEAFWFKGTKGINLYAEKRYSADFTVPKGIVQIAHGMRESTAYYNEFCDALVDAGFWVYIHDARGHGRTAGEACSHEYFENAGYCGNDAFNDMCEDLSLLTDIIHRQNPGTSIFLLGHSMGSVVSRLYAYRYGGKINGLIYSGTTGPAKKERIDSLIDMALKEAEVRGMIAEAKDTPRLIFELYNDRFKPVVTGFEYMSRDKDMVRSAVTSPYAVVPYRCGFYIDFLNAIRDMDSDEHIRCIPKNLPVFSVSGGMDPFGDYGEGVPQLFDLYRTNGIKDASYIIYEGGRHEMLREINRRDVFSDIIQWLQDHAIIAIIGKR